MKYPRWIPRSITVRKGRLLAGGFAAAGVAALLPTAAAVAFVSPPLVLLATPQGPAHLAARGAALDVTVEYSCTAQPTMFVGVQVTEAVGRKRIAAGSGSTSVSCDGATHVTVVRVIADPAGSAFARGTAAVDTSVFGCRDDFAVCGNDTVSRIVTIRR